jgi:hypothetical protein
METLFVRALVGTETTYWIQPRDDAMSLLLLGYTTDVKAAEANPGDVILVNINSDQHHGLQRKNSVVASTTEGDTPRAQGFGLVVPATANTWVPTDATPRVVCSHLPPTQWNRFTLHFRNATTGTTLSSSNSGATRSMVTLMFGIIQRNRQPMNVPGALSSAHSYLSGFNE